MLKKKNDMPTAANDDAAEAATTKLGAQENETSSKNSEASEEGSARGKSDAPKKEKPKHRKPTPEDTNCNDLAWLQLRVGTSLQYTGDMEVMTQTAFGSLDLYCQLSARNALESVVDKLMTQVSNTAFDCLCQAANPTSEDSKQIREVNLRYGLKAAAVVAKLVEVKVTLREKHDLYSGSTALRVIDRNEARDDRDDDASGDSAPADVNKKEAA